MVDREFLNTFLDEAQEMLDRWEAICLRLDKVSDQETLTELFRLAHNIKGSSKSVGLVSFGGFVHKAEDLITQIQKGEVAITASIAELLLDCHRLLLDWIEALRENAYAEKETSQLIARLVEPVKSTFIVQAQDNSPAFGVFEETPVETPPKPSLEQSKTEDPAKALASKTGAKDLGTILVENGQITQEQIEKAMKQQNRKLGEVLVESGLVSPEALQQALDQQKLQGHKADETIRVSLKKLDSIIRLIGELSIQHAIVHNAKYTEQLAGQHALEAISLAHKVIQDLQTEAMTLRMQPLDNLFQRMERVCRDVARAQQKPLEVRLKGTEVELDKTVIEKMKDPLVHILRNAVDHGIETPTDRSASGKHESATITIEGIQTATNVSIRIADDGRGLNEEKILAKAIEKGLVKSGERLSPEDIHQLIFLPGFSTAEKVTDVSGRGVGMDVVKRAVDDLGGAISIQSFLGQGTEFLITLPSTLSILDAVVVSLGQSLYAVPVQDVEEVVDMQSTPVETSTQKGKIINLRGRILPVENLSDYLPSHTSQRSGKAGVALITKHHNTTVAFKVDEVAGQQSIVVRQLEGKLAEVPGFAGATILSNGEPSMIIHLPQVIKSYLTAIK